MLHDVGSPKGWLPKVASKVAKEAGVASEERGECADTRSSLEGKDTLGPFGFAVADEVAAGRVVSIRRRDERSTYAERLVSRGPPPEPTTTISKEDISWAIKVAFRT
jgi:hypothetical protein